MYTFAQIVKNIDDLVQLRIDQMARSALDQPKIFAHLHVHSHFSVLDGLAKPSEIVQRAKFLGCKAVAITDHGSISALHELFNECKKSEIKPIIGVEFYVVDSVEKREKEKRNHLIVLAKNFNGVQNIIRQLSLANKQFFSKPRLSWEQALNFEDCIISTACCSGMLGRDDYQDKIKVFYDKYGDDFALEIMPIELYELQNPINDRAVELHLGLGIPIIATCDAHYATIDDAITHEVLLAVGRHAKWNSDKRWFYDFYVHMRSYVEMTDAFSHYDIDKTIIEKALQHTNVIADRCNVVLPEFKVHLPSPLDYE